jgi:hypothetical protein
VNQSAERLGLQKNVLRIGFDSSTEKMAFFNASDQKKEVAPLAVKTVKSSVCEREKILSDRVFLRYYCEVSYDKRFAIWCLCVVV